MRKRKLNIPFVVDGSKIPLVEFTFDGKEKHMALVDTGSESTLFSDKLDGDVNVSVTPTGYKMSLIGLSGETVEKPIMAAESSLFMLAEDGDYHSVNIEGIMSDLSSVSDNLNDRYGQHINVTLLIGSDFLKANGAKIDYRKRRLIIRR